MEILTGVMVAHQAVYTDYKTEPSRDLADWHEHILWPALARIKTLALFPNGEVKPRNRSVDVDDEARAFLASELAEQGMAEPTSTGVCAYDAPSGLITLP